MNLSPDWVEWFEQHGWHAIHWAKLGDPRASDREIMQWARTHHDVVFTHDLDFGSLLAVTNADGPSVIQIRTQDVMPTGIGAILSAALHQTETMLDNGALVIIDHRTIRARVLPLNRRFS